MDVGSLGGLDGQGSGGVEVWMFRGIRHSPHQRTPRELEQPTLRACRGSQTLNHVGFQKDGIAKKTITCSLGSPPYSQNQLCIYVSLYRWVRVCIS